MTKRLSFVLRLSDGCLNRALLRSEAAVFIDGAIYHHEYKTGGYFVAVDIPQGAHTVEIKSPKFQTERLEVDVDYTTASSQRVRYLMLNPSENHPEALRSASIRAMVSGAERIYILREKSELKIAEDNAEQGRDKLKLFCSGKQPQLPCVCRIMDKSAAKCEQVTISGADGDMYLLGEPLKYSHARSSAVIPLIRLCCDSSGGFFFVIPPDFRPDKESGQIKLNILADVGGAVMQAEVSVSPNGCTNLGEIKMKKGS